MADGFGALSQPLRQIGGHAFMIITPLREENGQLNGRWAELARRACEESPSQPSPSGTNRRKRQAMISLTRPRAFKAGTELSPKPVSSTAVAPHDLGFAKRETVAKPDRARLA